MDVTQAGVLLALDCDEIQGFLYAKPMSAEELDSWLEARLAVSTVLKPAV